MKAQSKHSQARRKDVPAEVTHSVADLHFPIQRGRSVGVLLFVPDNVTAVEQPEIVSFL